MDYSEYYNLILPWQVHYDESWKRHFYFNPLSNTSVWELPEEIQIKVETFYQSKFEEEAETNKQVQKTHIPKQILENPKPPKERQLIRQNYMSRPARKQVEQSLATQFAYKQGDEEYNIWYDKYLTDNKFKDREQALTRCDPELDSGFTKADHIEKFSSYFCIHFARGCCCEGANCKYYHRIPSYEECTSIDQSKDIFGRARFANHREDMAGIGSFLKESRTLYVSDFKIMQGAQDNNAEMYEILFRHFGQWGDIEDINLLHGKGVAFIRYAHRCMAEFAKEAMSNQPLDNNEIITIKWANDDPNPQANERNNSENEKAIQNTLARKKLNENAVSFRNENEGFDAGEIQQEFLMNQAEMEKTKNIIESCQKMDEILKRIDRNNNKDSGKEEEEEGESNQEQLKGHKSNIMPEFNDQPLFFNPN